MHRTLTLIPALAALAILATPALAATPTCVQGKAGVAPTATITFTAPTTNTDGTAISGALTYELFQGSSPTALTPVAKGLTSSPISVSTGLKDAETVYWDVVAVASDGTASAPSNVVCKTFPAGVPNAVTITIS